MTIDEQVIAEVYNRRRAEFENEADIGSEFGPEVILSGRFVGTRIVPIRTCVDRSRESPEHARVYDFEDGRALVFGTEGRGGDCSIHCLLVHPDGRNQYAQGENLIYAGWPN